MTTQMLGFGDYALTAVYSGDSTFGQSTSPVYGASVTTPVIAGSVPITGNSSAKVGATYTLGLPGSVNGASAPRLMT
jgi:hypothetical protein